MVGFERDGQTENNELLKLMVGFERDGQSLWIHALVLFRNRLDNQTKNNELLKSMVKTFELITSIDLGRVFIKERRKIYELLRVSARMTCLDVKYETKESS